MLRRQSAKKSALKFARLKVEPADLLLAVVTPALYGTVAGWFGDHGWSFDLLSTFRIQYIIVLGTALAILLIARRWWAGAFIGCFVALNAVTMAPFYLPLPQPARVDGFRVALFNVYTPNRNYETVAGAIRTMAPDVVALLEVDERWQSGLAGLKSIYPYQVWHPRPDNFGVTLLSRVPIAEGRIEFLDASEVPTLVATADTKRGPVSVVATHPLPPVDSDQWAVRNEHLEGLATLARALRRPVVVLGDLNVAPWSVHFRRLLEAAALVDSARGHGLFPTWPVRNSPVPGPAWLLATPLDHVLHSPDLVTVHRITGPDVGGDHLPVIANLAWDNDK